MTISQARKILGKMADKISDEEILEDIKTAELLKNLFFIKYSTKMPPSDYNVTKHGKT